MKIYRCLLLCLNLVLWLNITYAVDVVRVPFWDSAYVHLDSVDILWHRIDTTTAKIPTATLADSTDGGSIRSETCKIADSCDGGAARAEVSDSTNSPFRAAAHDTLWANLEEEIGDSLKGYLINSGDDTLTGTFTATAAVRAGSHFYIDYNEDDPISYVYFHGITGYFIYYAPTPYFGLSAQLEMANHAINGLVWPTTDSSAVHKRFVQVEIGDSLDKYYDSTKVASRASEEIGDSLVEVWTAVDKHNNRYVVPNFVHGRPDPPGDNVILSLEGYDAGTLNTWIFRDSTLEADQTDTIHISFVLPWGTTQCDSLILKYRTSSATTTTSCIANLRLSLDGISQWTYATDEASISDERLQLAVADADFDAGELATLQIIFEGDQNAWLKVVYVYLVVSE